MANLDMCIFFPLTSSLNLSPNINFLKRFVIGVLTTSCSIGAAPLPFNNTCGGFFLILYILI